MTNRRILIVRKVLFGTARLNFNQFGIPDNIEKLREEFALYRQLNSKKLFIFGPPCAGKSTLAKELGSILDLVVVNIHDIVAMKDVVVAS